MLAHLLSNIRFSLFLASFLGGMLRSRRKALFVRDSDFVVVTYKFAKVTSFRTIRHFGSFATNWFEKPN